MRYPLRERFWASLMLALYRTGRQADAAAPRVRTSAGDIAPGTEFAGYRIESVLGRGGMSVVYVAEHLSLQRKVALKLLAPQLSEDARFRERFVRESRVAAGIEHANIVPIYEAGEAEGLLFIAMRYIRGTDLGKRSARRGPSTPSGRCGSSGRPRARSTRRTRPGWSTAT